MRGHLSSPRRMPETIRFYITTKSKNTALFMKHSIHSWARENHSESTEVQIPTYFLARSWEVHVNVSFSTLLPFHIQKVHPRRGYRNPPLAESNRECTERPGIVFCFRYSWPTSRHASSCTKAPLCAINHVKPARSHKSLLWGNSPFQIYKMVVVGKRDVLVEMSEEWWYWGMRPDVWGILIWFASSSWFRAM